MTDRAGRADDIRPYREIRSEEGQRAIIKTAPTGEVDGAPLSSACS